jgi:hypothetical protein
LPRTRESTSSGRSSRRSPPALLTSP